MEPTVMGLAAMIACRAFPRLPAFSQMMATGSYMDGAHRHGGCRFGHWELAVANVAASISSGATEAKPGGLQVVPIGIVVGVI